MNNVPDFDLVRISKAKAAVGLSIPAVRKYREKGLKFYGSGNAVFFSKRELEEIIKREVQPLETKKPA